MGRAIVVDDDPSIRSLVRLTLEMEGYAVDVACDGQSALDLVRTREPDLVVLDIMMPAMDGATVARTIRSDPAYDHVAIVFLSALVTDDHVWDGWRTGADSYVTKPFDIDHLMREVDRVTQARAALAVSDAASRMVIDEPTR
ncbi:MAG: response regulator [Actinomycetota bacterium]|nr:response regulator [Actinomycetota bacterium]